MKVKIMGKEMLMLDKENVDLRYTEQLADSEQTMALAYFMRYLLEKAKSAQTVRESVSEIETLFEKKGWQAFCSGYVPCGLARPRTQEIYASAAPGAFAKTVLMPGDPLRSQFIAETFLENPVLVNNVRGVQGYTGAYKGVPVSVMASGMGMPSIGIYSHELYTQYGVENIIRVATLL